jgi:hypothetical protein
MNETLRRSYFWIRSLMQFALSYVRARVSYWQWTVIAVVAFSVLAGATGVMLKSRIVTLLPATMEKAAEPPTGVLHFLNEGIDSWKPMKLAITIIRSEAHGRLFETLQEFQHTGKAEEAGDLSYFSDSTKFQYPLSSLLPIEALEAMGIGSIRDLNIINLIMFVACLAAVGYLAVQVAASDDARPGATERQDYLSQGCIFAAAVLVGLTFYPNFMALVRGNIQIWINLFFALACLAWLNDRRFLAGALIASAAAIKPQLAALLLWALLWRQWNFSAGFLSIGIPVALLSVFAFGLHNNLSYLDVLATIAGRGEGFVLNESVNGIVHRLVEPDVTRFMVSGNDYPAYDPLVHALTLISTLVFAAIAFVPALLRRGEEPTIFGFAAASICFTIGSPIVWPFHYGILLPVFVLALAATLREPERDRNALLLMLGAAWVLCASYLPFTRLAYTPPWNVLENPHFFGGLLLLLVLVRLDRAGIDLDLPSAHRSVEPHRTR